MDATHYDKIADKLIQFNSKLPQSVDLESLQARCQVENMKYMIESMLRKIDELANADERGWIR
jgi:archaellum component FlaC